MDSSKESMGDDDNDEFLPEHTISMRRALAYCEQLIHDYYYSSESRNTASTGTAFIIAAANDFNDLPPLPIVTIEKEAEEAALTIPEQRQAALIRFWEQQEGILDVRKQNQEEVDECASSKKTRAMKVATITINPLLITGEEEDSSSSMGFPISGVEFRQRFQNSNQPCLIRGLDKTPYFSLVSSIWRSGHICESEDEPSAMTVKDGRDNNNHRHQSSSIGVNRDWFQQHIGGDTNVPVRFQPSPSSSQALLDDQGRAEECETKEMTLDQWIELLEETQQAGERSLGKLSSQESESGHQHFYLKDWHLQSFLRDKASPRSHPTATTEYSSLQASDDNCSHFNDLPSAPLPFSLYRVPPYFRHDLLNAFLTKFTDKGDYKFVYWGPKGSRTSLHCDVLNSFSWSFNVAGTKEWKFYPPMPVVSKGAKNLQPLKLRHQKEDKSSSSSNHPLVVIQNAGECIFVPCGWKHEVTNLEETLSVNHNWITTANIDEAWELMRWEMVAIEAELKGWNIVNDCWDARESMLRGCVGLDVTAFFLMSLSRLLELLLLASPIANNKVVTGLSRGAVDGLHDDEMIWQFHFDLIRLTEALHWLLCAPEDGKMEEIVLLEERLAAVLSSRKSAAIALKIAVWATAAVNSSVTKGG